MPFPALLIIRPSATVAAAAAAAAAVSMAPPAAIAPHHRSIASQGCALKRKRPRAGLVIAFCASFLRTGVTKKFAE